MRYAVVEKAVKITAPKDSRERRLLLETIRHYYDNPRSVSDDGCQYEDKSGNVCAVGRCMLARERRLLGGLNNESVVNIPDLNSLLKTRFRNLDLGFWQQLQVLHDRGEYWNCGGSRGMTIAGAQEAISIAHSCAGEDAEGWDKANKYLEKVGGKV